MFELIELKSFRTYPRVISAKQSQQLILCSAKLSQLGRFIMLYYMHCLICLRILVAQFTKITYYKILVHKILNHSLSNQINISFCMGACIGVSAAVLVAYFGAMLLGFHEVKEGYVGIYKKLGILQPSLTQPGFHFRIPFYQEFIEMKISIQTDTVLNIPCGTSNGTLVYFDKIQVVNKLRKEHVYNTVLNYTEDYQKFWITDKIHHEINQFCSKHSLTQIYIDIFDTLDEELMESLNRDLQHWAPGIEILSIRVTKPNIPQRIRKNFQDMEKIKVDYFISVQKENVRVQQEITRQRKQIIQMESNLQVRRIDSIKRIDLKENQLKMAIIEGEMIYEREKTKIQTQFLSSFEEATMYPALFTEKYMTYLAYDALTSNSSFILGNKIPNINLPSTLQ